jgi:hypothetical protein
MPNQIPDKPEHIAEEVKYQRHEEDNEDLVPESPMIADSKYVQNKFSSNYDQNNQDLDESTVNIADITPSENDIRNTIPESPMIDKKTKEKLKTLGNSLDSKQINQAIGNIDMRRLCK